MAEEAAVAQIGMRKSPRGGKLPGVPLALYRV
jgi:hypothetical protein